MKRALLLGVLLMGCAGAADEDVRVQSAITGWWNPAKWCVVGKQAHWVNSTSAWFMTPSSAIGTSSAAELMSILGNLDTGGSYSGPVFKAGLKLERVLGVMTWRLWSGWDGYSGGYVRTSPLSVGPDQAINVETWPDVSGAFFKLTNASTGQTDGPWIISYPPSPEPFLAKTAALVVGRIGTKPVTNFGTWTAQLDISETTASGQVIATNPSMAPQIGGYLFAPAGSPLLVSNTAYSGNTTFTWVAAQ